MNEDINLCKLLKGHEGENFYSPLFGIVKFNRILANVDYPIEVITSCNINYTFTKSGLFSLGYKNSECMLFPSKEERDWYKWLEKYKYKIPKTWDELIESNKGSYSTIQLIKHIENDPYYFNSYIYKATLALLKIHQLIEVGYGGNITNEEWENTKYKHIIFPYRNELKPGEVVDNRWHIAFHTSKQRDEFLSYPENIQLVKDFYMI